MLGDNSEPDAGVSGADDGPNRGDLSRRQFVVGGTAGIAGLTALSGCTDILGSASGSDTITMVLTPGTPSDVRQRYEPMRALVEDQVDGVSVEMQVPQDYSAVRPALESEQAEIGMDDVTLISNPDLMDVYGTTVTGGTAFYFSMMLTHQDSSIDERTDIEGKEMAFADRLSTSGSIFALYALMEAGLDIGDAPEEDNGDFSGTWTNHEQALIRLGENEADAAVTYGGNGMPHISQDAELPQRVQDKSAALDTIGNESPTFRPFWFSFPIPKQPVYARATWDADYKSEIGDILINSTAEQIQQYYPEDYNEEQLPFTTLEDTTIDDYQPVIDRLDAVGIDLAE
ncbi:phosphate/phosphite/phosphonate ABC transporter substrate-binding protein [Salinarchaeum chitinilyticum]